MTDTGWLFRASWPILRPDLKLSVLKVEACEQLDQMAKEERCRLVGEVVWSVEHGRLYARAVALPLAGSRRRTVRLPYGAMDRAHELIADLAGQGWADREIALRLGGGSADGVRRARERHGIPAGRVARQRKGRAA